MKAMNRPTRLYSNTTTVQTGHGEMLVTVSYRKEAPTEPFEVFVKMTQPDRCNAVAIEEIARIVSLALRCGIPSDEIIRQLRGITCCPVFDHGRTVQSIPDGIAQVLIEEQEEGGFDFGQNVPVPTVPLPYSGSSLAVVQTVPC